MGMKPLAVAVLLSLFLLSTTLNGAAAPFYINDELPLDFQNPGTTKVDAPFDDFTQTFMVRSEPLGQVVTDLNDDERPDVAVFYFNSTILDIFYSNQSHGFSFADRTTVTLSNYVTALAAGDMDNDGLTDLVATVNHTSANVIVLYQDTTFAVASGTIFATNLRPHAVILADLDDDAYLDVVTLFSRDMPSFDPGFRIHFYNDGYGLGGVQINLGSPPLSMQMPRLIVSGDFNGDGRVDLIVGDHGVGRVVGYVNGASNGMTWTATTAFDINGPTALMLEQLNGVGLKELVVSADGASKIEFRRYSAPAFSLYTEMVGELMPSSLGVLDHNGDQMMDVVRVSSQYHNITVFNTPTSYPYSYSSSISFPTPYQTMDLSVVDMDGDGKPDLVVISRSSSGNGTVTIYYQNLVTVSNANDNKMFKDLSTSLATIGDHDGDGSNEIVAYDPSTQVVRFMDLSSTNLEERTAPSNVSSLLSSDLNGDGYDDLVLSISSPAGARIWFGSPTFMAGGGSQIGLTSTLATVATSTVGDLDDDGDVDLALGGNGGVELFWSSGTGTLFTQAQHYLLSLPTSQVSSMACGELTDDDSRLDLAIVNGTSSRIEIYYQQAGTPKFLPGVRQHLGALPGIGRVMSGDLDSDGLDDLITSTEDMIHLYLQSPSLPNGFSEGQDIKTLAVPEGVETFDLGDLNDDGGLELAIATKNSVVLAHGFEVTYQELTRQTAGGSPLLLMAEDMDNDLKNDLVSYSIPSRAISFYYQNNFAPVAHGSVDGSGHLEGTPITFNATLSTDSVSDRDRLEYTWDFGDGESTVVTTVTTEHIYLYNAIFTVKLSVRDPQGSTSNITSFQIMVGDVGPTASLGYSSTSLIEGQEVRFFDQSTSFPDTITSWLWDFGDGGTSVLQNPVYVYAGNGIYDTELTVTDEDGSVDSAFITIAIDDSAPTSRFQPSVLTPLEKQLITFNDTSTSPVDDIVSWYWTFGDGGTSVLRNATHAYLNNNGTYPYLVTLLVTDSDNSSNLSSMTLMVGDTSPLITGFDTIDYARTYDESAEIRFVVNATATSDAILRYQWDFPNNEFVSEANTTFNTVTNQYNSSGSYLITVRVWDADSYSERSITLLINDPAPVADFSFTNTQNAGEVAFSAALSSDTENDQGLLQYRWNFEGTWTNWSTTNVTIDHVFSRDGNFTVRLEVRDDHSTPVSKTRNVIIDLLPPVISITQPVLKALVAEPIVIYANVTDIVGVRSVLLAYTIDNLTRTVVMTLGDTGEYFGQIPAQNRSMKITYRVIAEDQAGHISLTDPIEISVEHEDSTLFMLSSALLLVALLLLLTYLFLSRPIVDEVFVMYHDGTLLAHQTRRLKPGMDDDILGGMLIALQNFVRDSFKDESSTVLSRMDFGERKLLVERKDDFFMAVVLSGKRPGSAPQRMLKALNKIEDNYSGVLSEWDGDLEKVRGIRDETKPIFQRSNPLDRLKRKEGD